MKAVIAEFHSAREVDTTATPLNPSAGFMTTKEDFQVEKNHCIEFLLRWITKFGDDFANNSASLLDLIDEWKFDVEQRAELLPYRNEATIVAVKAHALT